jgi:hypothetical protein
VALIAIGMQQAESFIPAAISQARLPCVKVLRAATASEDAQFKDQSDGEQETFIWSCAILGPKTTGLPDAAIYVSPKQHDAPHAPQIQVSQGYGKVVAGDCQWFAVTIEDEPLVIGTTEDICVQDLVHVADFVEINKQLLLDYWNSTDDEEPMDASDMIKGIRKV